MSEKKDKRGATWRMLYGRKLSDEERVRQSTWVRYGKLYKCGNCGRIPFYTDILERNICYNCGHVMKYAEIEDGKLETLKYKYNRMDEAPTVKWEAY